MNRIATSETFFPSMSCAFTDVAALARTATTLENAYVANRRARLGRQATT